MPRYSVPPLYTDSAGFATNSPGFLDRDTPMEQQPTKQPSSSMKALHSWQQDTPMEPNFIKQPYLFPQQQQQSMQQTILPPMQAGSSGGNMGNAYGGIGGGGQQKISLGQIGLTFDSSRQGGGGGYNLSTFAEGGSVAQPQAQGLASLGRGQDSMLVHMTPGEVQGLQKLAMSAGGSLTTNPQTGLPEAGFLSSMLPMIAGVGLNAMFPGSGALIGAGIGGLTALATGSLSKGFMTGLGVFGGTQLGGALQGMGLNSAQQAAAAEMEPMLAGNTVEAATQSAQKANIDSLVSQAASNPDASMTPEAYREFLTKQASSTIAPPTAEQVAGFQRDATLGATPQISAGTQAALNRSPLDQTFAGARQLGTAQGLKDLYKGIGNQGLLTLAAPLATELMKPKTLNTADATQASKATIRPYTYSQTVNPEAQRQMSQFGFSKVPYFDQSYTAQPTFAAAEGGTVPSSDYYANLMSGTTSLSAPPPSADAMNEYLTKLNASLQYNPGTPGTPAQTQPTGTPTLDASGGYYGYDAATKSYKYFPGAAPVVNPNTPPVYAGEMGGGLGESPGYGGGVAPDNPGYELSMMGGNYGSPNNPGYELSMMGGNYEAAVPDVGPPEGFGYEAAVPDVGTGGLGETGFGENAGGTGYDMAHGGGIHAGLASIQTYAAGGRLLRGPGDGMSDSIPAVIQGAKPQRAALADGEFVIPADVVSHLGNGSTEAGSKHLYKMMDRIRKARTGNPKQGKQINAARFMPA